MDDQELPDTQTQPDYIVDSQEIEVKKPWGRLAACLPSLTSIDLFASIYTLGRAPTCDIFIEKTNFPDILNVSKEHFQLCKGNEEVVYLTDLSKNGTFVNNVKIGRNKRHIIHNDDIISIGHPNSKIYSFISNINHEDYDFPHEMKQKYFMSKKIGRGAYGEVYLAHEKKTFEKFAIKKMCKPQSNGSLGRYENIATEIEILTTFSYAFIIQMKEVFETDRDVFLILEYMPGGELTSKIVSAEPFPEEEVKFVFYQILLAVRYLHINGITHRDLKPENVLLKSNFQYPMVKVSDFGLSKIVEDISLMATTCGTISYAAPEVLNCRDYNKKVDVWSLGVILFYMLSKTQPFIGPDKETIARNVRTGKIGWSSRVWSSISRSAQDLTRKMLTVDPNLRLSTSEIFKHEWIEKDVKMKYQVEQLTIEAFEDTDSSEKLTSASKRPRLA